MSAWAKDQGISEDGLITFLADPTAALTRTLGMVIEHNGPRANLGYPRSKRFAMYVHDGEIRVLKMSESNDDPAGDDNPSNTLADSMISAIKQLRVEAEKRSSDEKEL